MSIFLKFEFQAVLLHYHVVFLNMQYSIFKRKNHAWNIISPHAVIFTCSNFTFVSHNKRG